jgi:hypothetical protein
MKSGALWLNGKFYIFRDKLRVAKEWKRKSWKRKIGFIVFNQLLKMT